MENPPERAEWVDGALVQKDGMTLKHGKVQGNLYFHWRNYKDSSGRGGEVYTEAPCRTNRQGRSPDVAYLTPELVAKYGHEKVLPQSFPLIAEIVSPTDRGEEILAKAQEYLQSGSQEVWLVFPESRWIIVATQTTRKISISGETIASESVLSGFRMAVDELLDE